MKLLLLSGLLLVLLSGCQWFRRDTRFERLTGDQTGIRFANTITESDSLNAFRFDYIYNGGGVGVGDLNNDGRTDVFFAGNMVSSRLYINRSTAPAESRIFGRPEQGDFRFDDVTERAGTTTRRWCTGVAIVDINQDGWLDIYVSTIHPNPAKSTANLLFINQGADADGVPHFREAAAEVGLADSSYNTQATFLDYDRDGDLDVFLLTNALESFNRNIIARPRNDGSAKSVDKLYRNDGPARPGRAANGLPHFTDVSRQAGIRAEGWGLGVCVNDVNQDGWPDIYVANDFQSNDALLVNNQDGTFTNQIADYLSHQSHNSMGVDIADINNDGYQDIAVVDMMPDDNLRRKTMFGSINYDVYERALRQGYQPQFVRNMLQLNQGPGPDGQPVFSDIGYLAGVYATDWSWSALFADFDNDGFRDLLITNGYRKDVTDQDFISYRNELSAFGRDDDMVAKFREQAEKLPGVKKPNFLFRNNGGDRPGDLTFTNQAPDWGLAEPSYTNGAAYADFDQDGDLDLVMNNLNAEAFVYRNNTRRAPTDPATPAAESESARYLTVALAGQPGNQAGLGAEVRLYYNGRQQMAQHTLQRGYKSTVDGRLHFGLGRVNRLDSLTVIWPAGRRQVLRSVATNQPLTLREADATQSVGRAKSVTVPFTDQTRASGLVWQQAENTFVDFKYQPCIPQLFSQQGPALVVGDANGDGQDDLYVTGASRRAGALFLQQPNATFRPVTLTNAGPPKATEETGGLFFDADGDRDQDLYLVGGGSEFAIGSPAYQDKLYVNNGPGRDGRPQFTEALTDLPDTRASGSCVVAADFDQDNDLDLFVGGRVTPGRYPETPRSYLLQNDGRGRFTDVTDRMAPGLAGVGMVTAARWTDTNGDRRPDLLVVGEWMAPTLFTNTGRGLRAMAVPNFASSVGWWSGLAAADFDGDGDVDFVAGNLGRNSHYQATPEQPVSLYARDFDNNGTVDPILTHYVQGKEYPSAPRGTLIDQMVGVRRLAKTFADYGRMTGSDLLQALDLTGATVVRATQFASVYLENRGGNQFTVRPLPIEAQLAPLNGLTVLDYNHDGHLDVLTVGNSYAPETLSGRYDASVGNVLVGDGRGRFRAVPMRQSGFCVRGDARSLAPVRLANGGTLYVTGKNQDWLQAYGLTR